MRGRKCIGTPARRPTSFCNAGWRIRFEYVSDTA
jgi:hypothetical protein